MVSFEPFQTGRGKKAPGSDKIGPDIYMDGHFTPYKLLALGRLIDLADMILYDTQLMGEKA